MERIQAGFLALLFMISGAGLSSFVMFMYLLLGLVPFNHITIFTAFSLFTYYLYGLFGMIYTALSALTLISCAIMYWFDMSPTNLLKQATNAASTNTSSNNTSNNTTNDDRVSPDIDHKLEEFQNYRNTLLYMLYKKAGITEDKIILINKYYKILSNNFDVFTDLFTTYIIKFREMTRDVMGLKTIYYLYDSLCFYKTMLDSFKSFTRMTLDGFHAQASNSSPTNNTNTEGMSSEAIAELAKRSADVSLGKSNKSDIFDFSTLQDISTIPNGLDMSNMEDIERQIANMSPEEKRLLDEMTMKMLAETDMGKLMNMFNDMNNINNINNINSETMSENNDKRDVKNNKKSTNKRSGNR